MSEYIILYEWPKGASIMTPASCTYNNLEYDLEPMWAKDQDVK